MKVKKVAFTLQNVMQQGIKYLVLYFHGRKHFTQMKDLASYHFSVNRRHYSHTPKTFTTEAVSDS
jgi:hypothetical protein